MTKQPPPDPVLTHFRAAVSETYGDRLERVVLFGSRARGDARRMQIMTWRSFCAT